MAEKILSLTIEAQPESIIEIGSGRGAFTHLFQKANKNIVAIEKDDILARLIHDKLGIQVYNSDILEVDMKVIIEDLPKPIALYGSLPYNQSKRIIAEMIKHTEIQNQFYIIQKEVADKYIAKAPQSNILSLTSSIYASSKRVLKIPPSAFKPQPNVNSALIHFETHSPKVDTPKELKNFIIQAFNHPRRKLSNNIDVVDSIRDHEYLTIRPAELSLEQYIELFDIIFQGEQKK